MGFELLWIIWVVCAVACVAGFYKFVYFLSIGYGFAVALGGIAVGVLFFDKLGLLSIVQILLFVAYGVRLSGFLLVRELKNALYRKTLAEATGDEKAMPVFVKACIWLFCATLYMAQVSPVFYRLYNGAAADAIGWVGAVVSVLGLGLESLADQQKSAQKAVNPHMVATEGLYKLCRCPNYLGEIIFWTGVLISALPALAGAGQYIMAVVAWVAIVFIMFNGAQRLEKRQRKNYGANPAYIQYENTTPIIIPFIPLYHLNKTEEPKV